MKEVGIIFVSFILGFLICDNLYSNYGRKLNGQTFLIRSQKISESRYSYKFKYTYEIWEIENDRAHSTITWLSNERYQLGDTIKISK